MKPATFPVGTLLIFGIFLLLMFATWVIVKPPTPPPELAGVLRPEYRQLAPFRLTDQHQQDFDERRLRGKWSMVFFGYLSCPDVCPMTLHELKSFRQLLADEAGADADSLQVLFVSVDPARDRPERLGEYVTHFNRDFIAATGSKQEIDNFAGQFGAGYIIEEETAAGQYLVSHTSAIFLVDPLGRSVAAFSQPHYASTLLSQYLLITRYFGSA